MDSCVAACLAMVHGLVHGLEATAIARLEATYIDRCPPDMRGVSLDRARELGLVYQWMQDLSSAPEDTVADLEDRLRDGPLIVTVWNGPLRLAQGGSGWQPSDRLLHAIALSGHDRRKFLYLDPARSRTARVRRRAIDLAELRRAASAPLTALAPDLGELGIEAIEPSAQVFILPLRVHDPLMERLNGRERHPRRVEREDHAVRVP